MTSDSRLVGACTSQAHRHFVRAGKKDSWVMLCVKNVLIKRFEDQFILPTYVNLKCVLVFLKCGYSLMSKRILGIRDFFYGYKRVLDVLAFTWQSKVGWLSLCVCFKHACLYSSFA